MSPWQFIAIKIGLGTPLSSCMCWSSPSRSNTNMWFPAENLLSFNTISVQYISPLVWSSTKSTVVQSLSWPFTLNWPKKSPLTENFCIRLLTESVTYMMSLASMVIPHGELKVPLPFPYLPNFRIGLSLLTEMWVWSLISFCPRKNPLIWWRPLFFGVNVTEQSGPAVHSSLSGVPDYFGRNKISSGGDLSHYSSASLY